MEGAAWSARSHGFAINCATAPVEKRPPSFTLPGGGRHLLIVSSQYPARRSKHAFRRYPAPTIASPAISNTHTTFCARYLTFSPPRPAAFCDPRVRHAQARRQAPERRFWRAMAVL